MSVNDIPISIGYPISYGNAITPEVSPNIQDILNIFNREIDQIRLIAASLNGLSTILNIDRLTLQEQIVIRASVLVTIHEHLINLFGRIRSILQPPLADILGGRKRRTTKRRTTKRRRL